MVACLMVLLAILVFGPEKACREAVTNSVEEEDRAKRAEAERDRLRNEILRRGWWRKAGAPCALCGYDGEGYYQPATHDCARLAAALEGRDEGR